MKLKKGDQLYLYVPDLNGICRITREVYKYTITKVHKI